MILSKAFERFAKKTPVTVMTRTAMEYALAPQEIDELFEKHADKQYTRELLFSSLVDLMGVVVTKIEPSVNAAYQEVAESLPVSLTAVYDKLNGVEPQVTSALVEHVATRLTSVIDNMSGRNADLIPGYRARVVDGNHLAATQRRLKVLHGSKAGPLPGHALVVLDPSLMLATHIIPCEDAHTQERALSVELLELVKSKDVWIGDRNFCTVGLMKGMMDRDACFIVRHHAQLPLELEGQERSCGTCETGAVFEQRVSFLVPKEGFRKIRRVTVRLKKPTRDGDRQIDILTNLPKSVAGPKRIADTYRERWTLETMFQSLTVILQCELDSLGYPKAALFGFAVAVVAYNIVSTVQAALRVAHGAEKIKEEVSAFYIANEVQKTMFGMSVATEESEWVPFQSMAAKEIATTLVSLAANIQLRKFKRHGRGPKKPVPKRTRFAEHTHVATARLLSLHSSKKSP